MVSTLPKPTVEIESVATLIETYVNEAFEKKYQEIMNVIRVTLRKLLFAFLVSGWSGAVAFLARTL